MTGVDRARMTGPDATDRDTAAGSAIEARHAAVRIGGRTVWEHLDLRIDRGEFVAVLGPNGVGKSTLIRAVLGLLPLSAGELRVLGARPGVHNSRIGYLPQRQTGGGCPSAAAASANANRPGGSPRRSARSGPKPSRSGRSVRCRVANSNGC
jgi:ATPase subunit of ABC transporter with duplicated ATPase domains